jgi:hypothetical protein
LGAFLREIKFYRVVTSEGTSLAEVTSSGIQYALVGRLVWAMGELLKKRKGNRTQKRYISPIRGETPSQPILTNFAVWIFEET